MRRHAPACMRGLIKAQRIEGGMLERKSRDILEYLEPDLSPHDSFCVLQLSTVPDLTIYGPPPEKRGSPLCSFNVEGVHATDLSTFLDFEGQSADGVPGMNWSRESKLYLEFYFSADLSMQEHWFV